MAPKKTMPLRPVYVLGYRTKNENIEEINKAVIEIINADNLINSRPSSMLTNLLELTHPAPLKR